MREKLKQIGLKSYEAMAYECLLKHGTLSGKEISKQTKIPHTKVYVTLNYLIEKGLVLIISKRPILFKSITPEKALRGYLDSKIKKIKKTETELFEHISKIQKRKPAKKLVEQIKILAGEDSLWRLSDDLIEKTNKTIKIVRTYDRRPEKTFKKLHNLAKSGKKVKIITTTISKDSKKRIKKDLIKNIEVRYYPIEELRFVIIDGKEALQSFVNPRNRSDRVTIHVESKNLAKALDHYFNKIWKKAKKI